MEDNVSLKGWPLGQPDIQAKFKALVNKDIERKLAKGKPKGFLGYGEMLEQIPINLARSRSTREAYSRSRSLQRVLRRAGLKDTTGRESQSVPVSSPSSGVSPHLRGLENGAISPVQEDVHALANVPKSVMASTSGTGSPCTTKLEGGSTKNVKPTSFLAKQFKLISNAPNTTPRRNIKILGKIQTASDEASFAACGAKVICVAEKVERDQLQERIRVHDCDRNSLLDVSSIKSGVESLTSQGSPTVSRLDSLSRSPGPLMARKTVSLSRRYTDCRGNSPSTVVSEIVSEISEVSIPETIMSSLDNFESGSRSKKNSSKTSFSNRRERWTSREIFGSFDFEGELDIGGTIAEGRNIRYFEHAEMSNPKSSSTPSCLDKLEELNLGLDQSDSPTSDSYSPCQSSFDSSEGWVTDHDHQNRGRTKQRGVGTRRMKVTSPSSLFRDGPWHNIDKPCQDHSSTNMHRKLSRKLSTSFNKRRKQQGIMHSPLLRVSDESKRHASLSIRNSGKILVSDNSSGSTSSKEGCSNPKTIQIAGLLSGVRAAHASKIGGAGHAKMARAAAISQQEAVMVFQDEVAQMMLEGGEIADIEEFLDGYMRLKTPFYLEVVEEFFRAMSYDCYKRPLDVKKMPKVARH